MALFLLEIGKEEKLHSHDEMQLFAIVCGCMCGGERGRWEGDKKRVKAVITEASNVGCSCGECFGVDGER